MNNITQCVKNKEIITFPEKMHQIKYNLFSNKSIGISLPRNLFSWKLSVSGKQSGTWNQKRNSSNESFSTKLCCVNVSSYWAGGIDYFLLIIWFSLPDVIRPGAIAFSAGILINSTGGPLGVMTGSDRDESSLYGCRYFHSIDSTLAKKFVISLIASTSLTASDRVNTDQKGYQKGEDF